MNDFDVNLDEKQSSLKVEFNFSNEVCNEYFAHQFKVIKEIHILFLTVVLMEKFISTRLMTQNFV